MTNTRKQEPEVVVAESLREHEHTPAIDLASSMRCEDCDWRAGGSEGWIACQALEHSTHNPGHRVTWHPAAVGGFLREDQLPPFRAVTERLAEAKRGCSIEVPGWETPG